MKNLYITHRTFPDGEISVQGRTSKGELKFGFRTSDYFGWKDKARDWTPQNYMPVFQDNKPAALK